MAPLRLAMTRRLARRREEKVSRSHEASSVVIVLFLLEQS